MYEKIYTVCPTRYRTWHFFNHFTTNEDIAMTTDTFLFVSHVTNVLLFKFRCDILVGVRIIKEMPGSVASGTPYINVPYLNATYLTKFCACKLNTLLHTKQRFVNIHIKCLVIKKWSVKHFTLITWWFVAYVCVCVCVYTYICILQCFSYVCVCVYIYAFYSVLVMF